jgi:hypothetical protein
MEPNVSRLLGLQLTVPNVGCLTGSKLTVPNAGSSALLRMPGTCHNQCHKLACLAPSPLSGSCHDQCYDRCYNPICRVRLYQSYYKLGRPVKKLLYPYKQYSKKSSRSGAGPAKQGCSSSNRYSRTERYS